MANIPAELKYTKSHEWVEIEDGIYTIGLTDHAQEGLGDLVGIDLPEEGDEVEAGESFGEVESVKAASEVFSPVSGVVCEVNEDILDAPEQVNEDPYGSWLIKVQEVSEVEELLDAAAYEQLCAEEE